MVLDSSWIRSVVTLFNVCFFNLFGELMNILTCIGGGERIYSSEDSLIRGLRKLGHRVTTIGPHYDTFQSRLPVDIILPDKPFPELYDIDEVLNQAGDDYDFILQIEPHFYLTGGKPQIPVFYYYIDTHTGVEFHHRYLKEHSALFDAVFLGQPHLAHYFDDIPMQFFPLPLAFDEERYSSANNQVSLIPRCSISFVGQSGINRELLLLNAQHDDIGTYVSKLTHIGKYHGYSRYDDSSPFFAYAERAEYLIRLMQDFDTRIYIDQLRDEKYVEAIRTGRAGFNCSLLHDLNLHFFEIAAAGVPLVTDILPNIDPINGLIKNDRFIGILPHIFSYAHTFPSPIFKPFSVNFELDYDIVKAKFKCILDDPEKAHHKAAILREYVWRDHSWTSRAQSLVETVEPYLKD